MSEVFTDRLSSGWTKVTFPLTNLNAKRGSARLFVTLVCMCMYVYVCVRVCMCMYVYVCVPL